MNDEPDAPSISDEAEAAWQAFKADPRRYFLSTHDERLFKHAYRQSLLDAADAIQALHPGEVKASVEFLRDRAARLDRATKENR